MAVKTFNTRIRLKEDTYSNWNNPNGANIGSSNTGLILLSGELGFDKDKQNFKIGDGTKRWDQLKYIIGNAIIADYIASPTGVTLGDPIADTDSLNVALAKLQSQVNSAVSSGVTDVKINSTSIVLSHIANLSVDGTYNSSTNKLATEDTVSNAIGDLDVNEFPIGELTNIANSSNDSYDSIKILSISEEDGIIQSEQNGQYVLYVDIDSNAPYTRGEYNNGIYKQGNALATIGSITNVLSGLDASNIQPITFASAPNGTTITLKGITQTDGAISQGSGSSTITIGNGALKIQGYGATSGGSIPTSSATSVFNANTTADTTLSFSNAFVLSDSNIKIGLRTNKTISATNNIATMEDIASLSGAMHFVGSIDKVHNSIPSSGKYYTASIGGTTYYLHVNGTTGTATSVTPSAGDTLIVSGTGSNVTPLETGDMVVYSGNTAASVNVVQTNMTIGIQDGQVAPNVGALTSDKIIVSTNNGIASSNYSITDIASHTIGVTTSNNIVTVSDILTVGGSPQAAQSFTITGNNGISASSSGNNITIGHTNSSYTPVTDLSALKIKINSTGHITEYDALTNPDLGQGFVRTTVDNGAGATDINVTFSGYKAVNGGIISLIFQRKVPANARLNINSTGWGPIYWNNTYLVDNIIKAGDRCLFMYNSNQNIYSLISIDRCATQSNASGIETTAITDSSTALIDASNVQTVLGTLAKFAVNTENANSLALDNKEYFSTATNQTIKFHKVSKTGDYNDLNNRLIEGKNIEISNIANISRYKFYDFVKTTGTTRIPIGLAGQNANHKFTWEVEGTFISGTADQTIIGWDNNGSSLTGIRITNNNKFAGCYRGTAVCTSSDITCVSSHRYYLNFELDPVEAKGTIYIKDLNTNEVETINASYTVLSTTLADELSLFSNISNNVNPCKSGTKLHYAKAWIDDKSKVYAIPAIDTENNKVGVYDIQKNKFYPTGTSTNLTIEDANERQENVINALVGDIYYTDSGNGIPVSGHEPMSEDLTLHNIAKTGNTDDLIQGNTLLLYCGSSTLVIDTES